MLLNPFLCQKSISDSYQHFRVEVVPHIYRSQERLHLLPKGVWISVRGLRGHHGQCLYKKNHTSGGIDGVLTSLLFVLTWLSACLCLLTLFANCFLREQSVRSVLTAVGFCSKSGCSYQNNLDRLQTPRAWRAEFKRGWMTYWRGLFYAEYRGILDSPT